MGSGDDDRQPEHARGSRDLPSVAGAKGSSMTASPLRRLDPAVQLDRMGE
jgi:hypothetical protein